MVTFHSSSDGVDAQCPKCGGERFTSSTKPERDAKVAALDPVTCNECGYVTTIENARRAAFEARRVD